MEVRQALGGVIQQKCTSDFDQTTKLRQQVSWLLLLTWLVSNLVCFNTVLQTCATGGCTKRCSSPSVCLSGVRNTLTKRLTATLQACGLIISLRLVLCEHSLWLYTIAAHDQNGPSAGPKRPLLGRAPYSYMLSMLTNRMLMRKTD